MSVSGVSLCTTARRTNYCSSIIRADTTSSTTWPRCQIRSSPFTTTSHPIRISQIRLSGDYIRKGREQLNILARRALFGVAVSNFNRREMLAAGFRHVEVLPVRTDYSAFSDAAAATQIGTHDWLYVGRVVGNKCQHRLVQAFACYSRNFDQSAHLVLVGDLGEEEYVRQGSRRSPPSWDRRQGRPPGEGCRIEISWRPMPAPVSSFRSASMKDLGCPWSRRWPPVSPWSRTHQQLFPRHSVAPVCYSEHWIWTRWPRPFTPS